MRNILAILRRFVRLDFVERLVGSGQYGCMGTMVYCNMILRMIRYDMTLHGNDDIIRYDMTSASADVCLRFEPDATAMTSGNIGTSHG